ncbi:TPA: ribosomal-protein-alanine N-acetyltransferase [Candidatus Bathyarchaeota archaeon]|nr:ribosomal-protein-alanine N-acetyltransferase [Candidatus Bathyarchaeota archaeon]
MKKKVVEAFSIKCVKEFAAPKEVLEQVYSIEKLSFKNPYPKYLFYTLLMEVPEFFLVCLMEGRVVGYIVASLKNGEGHILSLAVHPNYRRRGIGSALLAKALTLMRIDGAWRVKLEVSENNVPALEFYKSHGFKIIGRIESYYEDGSGALLLQKTF